MKLSEYAKLKKIHYKTALRWFNDGKIPNARQTDKGTIVIEEPVDLELVKVLQEIRDEISELRKLIESE